MRGAEAVEHFRRLVQGRDDELRLDEAALVLAAALRPDGVDVDAAMARLDELAAWIDEPTLDGLRRHLFDDLGFAGDTADYHDPSNSFLDEVIERRRGLPITLSVLTVEVGRRAGVPLAPVGLPGHFLVRDRVDPDVFVDPFHGGALLTAGECRALAERLHPGLAFQDRFLDPVSQRAVLVRMLANLAGTYRQRGERVLLTAALDLRAALPDMGEAEQRELALLLAAGGRYDVAADRLEALGGDDERTAAKLRARLN